MAAILFVAQETVKIEKRKKNYHFHEIYGKRSQKSLAAAGFEVMTKKIALYSVPLVTLSKTTHVNYYKILYLSFLKLFLLRNI